MRQFIDSYGNKFSLDSVLDLDDGAIHYGEGQIESIERKVENLSNAFCCLVGSLVEKKVLDIEDIKRMQGFTSGFREVIDITEG